MTIVVPGSSKRSIEAEIDDAVRAQTTEARRLLHADAEANCVPIPLMAPRAVAGVIDLFAYVVVLNLFVEYVPVVISETFTLSVLTALLLKGVLELVAVAKKRVRTWFTAAERPTGKALAALGLWAVLFGSKFVVLEVVHLVFGGAVQLGGFFSVTLLILVLMLARAGVRQLLATRTAGDIDSSGR